MVPERLMQPLEMTDLLPEANPGRSGFSESDMGHCPGKIGQRRATEQHKFVEADMWGLLVYGTFGI